MKIGVIGGVVGAAVVALLIIIFGKEDLICSFRNNVINLFKRYDIEEDINNLKVMNSDKLLNIKYTYITEAKRFKNSGDSFKSFSILITIFISLVSITIPIATEFTNDSLNKLDNVLNHGMEIIKQEDVSKNEGAKKVKQINNKRKELNDFKKEMFDEIMKILTYAAIGCMILAAFILFRTRRYYDKASHYETLVQYIDDELIEKNKI